MRGGDQLELSGRHGITREVLGLRSGSLPVVKLASARTIRRRAANASAVAVRPADTAAHADLDLPTAPADAVVIGVEVVDEERTEPRALAADAPATRDDEELEEPTAEELEAPTTGELTAPAGVWGGSRLAARGRIIRALASLTSGSDPALRPSNSLVIPSFPDNSS